MNSQDKGWKGKGKGGSKRRRVETSDAKVEEPVVQAEAPAREVRALTLECLRLAATKSYMKAMMQKQGEVYTSQDVPGLSDVNPEHFAMSFTLVDGTTFTLTSSDDTKAPERNLKTSSECYSDTPRLPWFFTQSTFKPLVYAMALERLGAASVHRSVGSKGGLGYGAFEALPDGRAPNPLINSGALTLLSKLHTVEGCTEEEIAQFCCTLGDPTLMSMRESIGTDTDRWYDEKAVAATEADSIRNCGLCCFLSSRTATGDAEPLPKTGEAVNDAVRLYCVADCLKTNTEQLSRIAATFANAGCTLDSQERLLSSQTVSMTLSQMLSAGMYEASGDWSREVGIAAKSGVSGAIVCVMPAVCGIAVYAPKIDEEGNSVRGMSFVRELVRQLPELNMFFSP